VGGGGGGGRGDFKGRKSEYFKLRLNIFGLSVNFHLLNKNFKKNQ